MAATCPALGAAIKLEYADAKRRWEADVRRYLWDWRPKPWWANVARERTERARGMGDMLDAIGWRWPA